ncbi:MAG TPA: alpha-glucosidase [Terriglobia bacterium]|nr:alpha-glucosidase [Terriglobia bacterium]
MKHTGCGAKRFRVARIPVIMFLAAGLTAAAVAARPALPTAHKTTPWWQHAVFYEVYPRSFQDTDGDGVGDLNGITAKLDYLHDLGVDALWITPFYPSPQVDFGYDISDYENVDPSFGNLADFDRLLDAAHQRGMKILMDMVLNHTSDQHPWFIESRSSRTDPKRDWYIWRDGNKGGPPNNWISVFGGPAWTFDPRTGQWFYHYFYPQQPDLNWRNPAVEKAMFDQVSFWLKRGVDGFRLDAVANLFEDPRLRDNPVLPSLVAGSTTEHQEKEIYDTDLPEVHTELQRLRKLTDAYPGRVLVGETWPPSMAGLLKYYGPDNNELQLPFNFFFTKVSKLDAAAFRSEVEETERVLDDRWTTWVLSNHDLTRAYTRYADGRHNDQIAKILGTMVLTLRGTPFIYYGEELGMQNNDPKTIDEVRDPVGKREWPTNKGRDGERTPLPWTPGRGAGFTTGKPWLPIQPSARTYNVETESADPASILNYYKALLRLRRESPALLDGEYQTVGDDPHVFAYLRKAAGQTVVVALNMSADPQRLDLPATGLGQRSLKPMLSSLGPADEGTVKRGITLKPFEAMVLSAR